MARTTLCTPELIKIIALHIEAGNYRSTACAAVGISRMTLNRWERAGAAGEEPYVGLFEAMTVAEGMAEMRLLREVNNAGPGWQAKAWQMERRFATKWCGRVKQQVAEHVDALTDKLKSDPELHRKVVEKLSEDETTAKAAH